METMLSGIFELLVSVAHAEQVVRVGKEGNSPVTAAEPSNIIVNVYNFALMLGGILAFGMIVYGAVKYTMAAGNPTGQSDARDVITQALLGLLLLVGAFILLNLINPELVDLRLSPPPPASSDTN